MSSTAFKRLIKLDGSLLETLMMFTAEVTGTGILVFVGCTGCIGGLSSAPSNMQISLAFGFAIIISIAIFGHISGAHVNPSVTIAAVILGRMSVPTAMIYIIGQCVGGVVGYGMLMLVTPYAHRYAGGTESSTTLCVCSVNDKISIVQGLAVEILATWMLVLVVCAVWDSRNENYIGNAPVKIGLTVVVLAMVAGPYSGCSMNTARSLGPAVWNNNYKDHWVYWLGPTVGSISASLNYLIFAKLMAKSENGTAQNSA